MSTTAVQVNGDVPHSASAFIDHLLQYPVVSDSINAVKSNPIGQKSFALTDSAYQSIIQPLLSYLQGPYQYISPYVKKVDALGDRTLCYIDGKLPILKKPTGEIYHDGKTIVFFPIRVAQTGKEHVLNTWDNEYKKTANGDPVIIKTSKAAIGTGLVITTELFTTGSSLLSNKKDEVKRAAREQANNVNNK